MTWQNRRAWHVSLASMLYYCIDHYHGNTLHYRWLVKSCTVGKLLPTDACFFSSSHDNGNNEKPDFDVQVF